jgi:hypothetical protein
MLAAVLEEKKNIFNPTKIMIGNFLSLSYPNVFLKATLGEYDVFIIISTSVKFSQHERHGKKQIHF